MRTKPDPDAFETFYKDVRGRLLLQAWALTGDLPAAQKGVRDALVVGWHHWRKVSRLDDPESFVRPQAWSRAMRRATARPFHRERGLDDGIKATLAALAKLPMTQRKVLLLAHLTTLPLDQLAREVGITQVRAERELQAATAAFALSRGVPTTSILGVFEPMAAELRETRWPRPTILTRAGSARRRVHTAIGAVVAVAAFAGSGWVVTDANGERPGLDTLSLHGPTTAPLPVKTYPLTSEDMLSDSQVDALLPGAWATELTSDNTDRDGLLLPCQQQRFADKSPEAALMRTLTSENRQVGQATEVSATPEAAQAAYTTTLGWYAGCQQPRVQLISTRRVSGVGDEAMLLWLRDWAADGRPLVASVARTGAITTSVVASLPPTSTKPVAATTRLLAAAVDGLCQLPSAGACRNNPTTDEVDPLPGGESPAMLDEVDLPPVPSVTQPWSATAPVTSTADNLAATSCDSANFHRKGVTGDLTRSYVVPEATNLPAEFGLTETIGSFGTQKAATKFIQRVRDKLAQCPKDDLGTKIEQIAVTDAESVWRVTVEISDKQSVVYLMSVVQTGDNVAQIGFVPSGAATISDEEFVALTHRAALRLVNLG
ncbi:RNA polymerase sigma factor [Nocardioides sp.]|uniref:RNA polymerase sigma factor n=1 Tax=Nocardioides sp. TaxID=35761 RepID=UPI0039E524E6